MNAVLDGLQSEFKALCDRTDFESKIEALKKAGNMSDRSSKLKELFKLFDKCGIKYMDISKFYHGDYYLEELKTIEGK